VGTGQGGGEKLLKRGGNKTHEFLLASVERIRETRPKDHTCSSSPPFRRYADAVGSRGLNGLRMVHLGFGKSEEFRNIERLISQRCHQSID